MSDQNNSEKMEETQVMAQAEPAAGGEPEKARAVKVRPKEKAGEAIRRELAAKGVWHTGNEIEGALDALYAAYEADGTVPTREAFAAACGNAEAGEAVAKMMDDPFVRKPLGKRVAAIAAVAVLVAACAGAAVFALQPGGPLPVAGQGSTSISEAEEDGGSKPASSSKTDDEEDEAEEKDAESEPGSEAEKDAGDPGADEGGAKEDDGGDGNGTQSQGGGSTGNTATGGGTQGKPSGGTGSAPQQQPQQPAQPSQPAHTHTWVGQTAQQWVPNNVWVVDQAAWDEPIYTSTWVCKCGATFGSEGAVNSHLESAALSGDFNHSYSVSETITGYNHHDEVGHWEDRGYNQTVVTGYVCSGCGATK